MDRLKKYLVLSLLVALLLALARVFPLFFFENVVRPVALVFWAILRLASSVSQNVYWLVLITVCCILIIRLIPADSGNAPPAAYHYKYRAPDRTEYWREMIAAAESTEEDAQELRDNLQKLLKAALPRSGESHSISRENLLATGRVPLSPQADRYLFPPEDSGGALSHAGPPLKSKMPLWLQKWMGKQDRGTASLVDEILTWIETEMELNHGRESHTNPHG